MPTNKIYLVGAIARRNSGAFGDVGHNAWLAQHETQEEAAQAGLAHMLKVCPVTDGWTGHNITVQEWQVSAHSTGAGIDITLRSSDTPAVGSAEIVLEGPDLPM